MPGGDHCAVWGCNGLMGTQPSQFQSKAKRLQKTTVWNLTHCTAFKEATMLKKGPKDK